jgi:phage gp29-like protein
MATPRRLTRNKIHRPTPELSEVASLLRDTELFQGFLNTLENPDKVLRLECGGDISVYDDISREARVGSVLRTRAQAVIGKEWDLVPASDDSKDMQIADYVKQVFLSFPFDTSRRSILRGGLLKGFSVSEIIWDQSEGDTFIKAMRHRAQRRFRFDLDSNLRLLTQDDPLEGINLTKQYPYKFQNFVFGDEAETPYGVGLGRELYWPWWFKKNGIKFWLMFCEQFGSPTKIGKYQSGATKKDKDVLLDALDALQSTSSITIPEGMSIDLIQAAKSGSVSTQAELTRYMDEEIAVCVLGQSATTTGTAGRLGNDNAQADVREDLIKADADALCEHLNPGVVRWLVDYQFPGHGRYPKMWIRCGDEADLNKLSERDKTLGESGVKFTKKYFMGSYGLQEDDFYLVDEPKTTDFSEQGDTEVLDELLEDELADWQPLMQPLMQPLYDLIDQASSIDELRDKLQSITDRQDLQPLIDSLAPALLKARALGDAIEN